MNKKLCILTGVGPESGTGAEIARYFSKNGYHVAMIARTENNLKNLEKKYNNTTAYPCDVGNIKDFKQTINEYDVYSKHRYWQEESTIENYEIGEIFYKKWGWIKS